MRKIWHQKKSKNKPKSFLDEKSMLQDENDFLDFLDNFYMDEKKNNQTKINYYKNINQEVETDDLDNKDENTLDIKKTNSNHTTKCDKTRLNSPTVQKKNNDFTDSDLLIKSSDFFSDLIISEYDESIVKTSWMNVVINTTSVSDICQNQLKLFRVELRGSNLYLYKPDAKLNIKCFKFKDEINFKNENDILNSVNSTDSSNLFLNNDDSTKATSRLFSINKKNHSIDFNSKINFENTDYNTICNTSVRTKELSNLNDQKLRASSESNTLVKNNVNSWNKTKTSDFDYENNSNRFLDDDNLSMKLIVKQQNMVKSVQNLTLLTLDSFIKDSDINYELKYFSTKIPHPHLCYDASKNMISNYMTKINEINNKNFDFEKKFNTIEALLHFYLFNSNNENNDCTCIIRNTLPLIPNFEQSLKVIFLILKKLFSKEIEDNFNLFILTDRILSFLNLIKTDYIGVLLVINNAVFLLKIILMLKNNLELILKNIVKDVDSEINDMKTELHKKIFECNDYTNFFFLQQKKLINLLFPKKTISFDSIYENEININFFLNQVNLMDLAHVINYIDTTYLKSWSPFNDKSLLFINKEEIDCIDVNDIFFCSNPLISKNDNYLHYLKKLFVYHLFIDNFQKSFCDFSLDELKTKAKVVQKWIDLGSLLLKLGNLSSWHAISSIIFCSPVLRLKKLWFLIKKDYLNVLKNDWAPILFKIDKRFLNFKDTSMLKFDNHPFKNVLSCASKDQNINETRYILSPKGLGLFYPKENVVPFFGDLMTDEFFDENNEFVDLQKLNSKLTIINNSFKTWNSYIKIINNDCDLINNNENALKNHTFININNNCLENEQIFNFDKNQKEYLSSEKKKLYNNFLILNHNCAFNFTFDQIMRYSLEFESEFPENFHLLDSMNSQMKSKVVDTKKIDSSMVDESSSSTIISKTLHLSQDDYNTNLVYPNFNNNNGKINLTLYESLLTKDFLLNKMNIKSFNFTYNPFNDENNIIIKSNLIFKMCKLNPESHTKKAQAKITSKKEKEKSQILNNCFNDIIQLINFNDSTQKKPSNELKSLFNESEKSFFSDKDKKKSKSKDDLSSFTSKSSKSSVSNFNYKYFPLYSNIDDLINLLIIDVKNYNDDIHFDLNEFRYIFLFNYNFYISTSELLKKIEFCFKNSKNAAISIMKKDHLKAKLNQKNENKKKKLEIYRNYLTNFPEWNLDSKDDQILSSKFDYSILSKIQINILKVLFILIENFFENILFEESSKKIFLNILKLCNNEIFNWYNLKIMEGKFQRSFELLVKFYKKLKDHFNKKLYSTLPLRNFEKFFLDDIKFTNHLNQIPSNKNLPNYNNILKIQKFLFKFNTLVNFFYKGIILFDWINIYKIIESILQENTIHSFNSYLNDDKNQNFLIFNFFDYFENFITTLDQKNFLNKFPLVFCNFYKFYLKFKKYLLLQLLDCNINMEERLNRIKTILTMFKVLTINPKKFNFLTCFTSTIIPSFVETVIIHLIKLSKFKNLFGLWIKASSDLSILYPLEDKTMPNLNYENVYLLVNFNLKIDDSITFTSLPCFSWIVENFFEISKSPNFFNHLINFNKRYTVYNFIKEINFVIQKIPKFGDENHVVLNNKKEFDFLFFLNDSPISDQNIFQFLTNLNINDYQLDSPNQKKKSFINIKKNDLKNSKSSMNNNSSIGDFKSIKFFSLNKSQSVLNFKKLFLFYKPVNAKSKISVFFSKSRSLSMAVIGMTNNPVEKIVDSTDLPSVHSYIDSKQKPAFIITLKNKKIYPVYSMPFSFKIDSDKKNDDYFLQALNQNDFNDWISKLNYANRHWFYSKTLNEKYPKHKTIFGLPIELICKRENTSCPLFLNTIFEKIENDFIKEIGIYRLGCSQSDLNFARNMINKTIFLNFDDESLDSHVLACIVKTFFRELPDSILTDHVFNNILNNEKNNQNNLDFYKKQIASLPFFNYNTLKLFIGHLNKVSKCCNFNKMNSLNLAIVISPSLTESLNIRNEITNVNCYNLIIQKMIDNFDFIFCSKN